MNSVLQLGGLPGSRRWLLPLAPALVFSVVAHAVVLWGVHFTVPDPAKFDNTSSPLEVVLVNSKSRSKPVHADALAQADLDGGGNTDLDRRAKSPLPVPEPTDKPDEPQVQQAQQRVQRLEQQARQLMTQLKSDHAVDTSPAKPQPEPQAVEAPNAVDLVEKSLQMARMEAQISRDWSAYQKRPRREFVGARTQNYALAAYIEDWRTKVERVGNLNYPQDAKDQKLYGTLQLTVSLRADGTVDSVEINRSSGHKLLDEAAIRIVKLGAPYAPFPESIRKNIDILSITRVWTFTHEDHLVSGG